MSAAAAARKDTLDYKVPFSDLCKIYVAGKKEKKAGGRLLEDFIAKWRARKESSKASADESFYPFMRLLLPELDKNRQSYSLKENSLTKVYLEALGLNEDHGAGQMIVNWEKPQYNGVQAGNFTEVIAHALDGHAGSDAKAAGLTVGEVNDLLDELAQVSKAGIARRYGAKVADAAAAADVSDKSVPVKVKQARILNKAITRLSASDNRWLAAIILKASLKCGISEKGVFSKYHPDAATLWNHCQSLKKVCVDLHDKSIRLNNIGIELFTPFKPMLAERMEKTSKIMQATSKDKFFVETKYDGERMQLHKRGREYRWWSRRGVEYTHAFGGSPSEGTFTPICHCLFFDGTDGKHKKIESCILDGEMMIWNHDEEVMKSMGDGNKEALAHNLTANQARHKTPLFIVFDVVMLNGVVLADTPLEERVPLLKSIFAPDAKKMRIAELDECINVADLETGIHKAIDSQEEGIIIKRADSKYVVDGRAKMGWMKWKPEYVDSLSDHLDLTVIGGYYGEGWRGRGKISHFLLGACDNDGVWYSVCKVGAGYTKEELKGLNELLMPKMNNFKVNDKTADPCIQSPPVFRLAMPGYKMKPDLWIRPEDSIVIEVKAAEISPSNSYAVNYTLRFPRVVRVREDKNWNECNTVQSLRDLYAGNGGKMTKRGAASNYLDEDSYRSTKKQKPTSALAGSQLVAGSRLVAGLASLPTKSALFDRNQIIIDSCKMDENPRVLRRLEALAAKHGMEVAGPDTMLQKLAKMHSAKVVANFPTLKAEEKKDPPFRIIIGEQYTIKAKRKVQAAQNHNDSLDEDEQPLGCNVFKPEWLVGSIETGVWQLPVPVLRHHVDLQTRRLLEDYTDEFGDQYTALTSKVALEAILSYDGWEHDLGSMAPMELATIEQGLLGDPNARFFREFAVCFCGSAPEFDLPKQLARFYGARLVELHDDVDSAISHVVCSSSATGTPLRKRLAKLNKGRYDREQPLFHIVRPGWIIDSAEQNRSLDTSGYLVPL